MMTALGIVFLLLFTAGFTAILVRMAQEDERRRIAPYKKKTYLHEWAEKRRNSGKDRT